MDNRKLKNLFWRIIPHKHCFCWAYERGGIRCLKCGKVFYIRKRKGA